MYGRLGYYHFIASTQVRLAREAEASAVIRARNAVKVGTDVEGAAKKDSGMAICWVCVGAVVGSFALAIGYASFVGA